ncbi:MAG TPA: PEP-CTERM sorting domain-containing protein [Phycisphaerae bacterium]|jgi:hypothetical protein|nr:PEP-CTERM sorting domain-containing protein [Phycisphaerae bacterium]HOB76634.1 PEP-CTERM sorting domain-containing protein [Phycisphaerae bacterium]HOJ53687.1 PEP-CTERM sorting domain-containing protein [Phycisphaerae bacterium]HOL27994.1 PEP-CTERM sorting domain-containing protein [Phycisphaerae bacterium]HPP22358.1 PEP-CTERM sorting domain-containing protein [Phycisphaerae bacterium]
MRLVCSFVTCALAASVAYGAGTVNLTMDNLEANRWKVTATAVYGDPTQTHAFVAETNHYAHGGTGNFQFYTQGGMDANYDEKWQWAGISTNDFAGMPLANITSAKIRVLGASGDTMWRWQPPTFVWVLDNGSGEWRTVRWVPWGNEVNRSDVALTWFEFDAATEGRWLIEESGAYYNSLAELQAALPNAFFDTPEHIRTDYGWASDHGFNVGNCPVYADYVSYVNGVTGYVDWFEIGVNGDVTRYDLGVVPEPASLALMGGLLGLGALRRRK